MNRTRISLTLASLALFGAIAAVVIHAAPDQADLSTFEYDVAVDVFADGLQTPWAIAFIDQDTALVTERPGPVRLVRDGRLLPDPIAGTPETWARGQGGMLDVTLGPDYEDDGWIYLAYSHGIDGERAMTRVVRGRIRDHEWIDEEVIYEAPRETYVGGGRHFGTRVVFDPDGYLYFSIGDRGQMNDAQDLSLPNGKIHRLWPDGSIPEDNPFIGTEDALPTIYAYGNRNPQGLAIHPETGRLWIADHGPRGGDMLQLIQAGANYGWPVISYGINYDGSVLTPHMEQPGMEQPIFYWTPSIAVSGLNFYDADLFDRWRGRALAGALRQQQVQLLNVHEDRVMHAEVIVEGRGRVREATVGPDGAIYLVLNNPDRIERLRPVASIFWEEYAGVPMRAF